MQAHLAGMCCMSVVSLIVLGKEYAPVKAGAAALIVSAAAGVGEEALFRGTLQHEVAGIAGDPGGLLVGALVFGIAHGGVTPNYALQAAATGAYFGYLYQEFGHTILVPAICHTIYDATAFWIMHYQVSESNEETQTDLLFQLKKALAERNRGS